MVFRLGIYYSVVSNEYLNVGGGIVRPASTATKSQTIVTQDQYADIVVQQLTELWTNYGTSSHNATSYELRLYPTGS